MLVVRCGVLPPNCGYTMAGSYIEMKNVTANPDPKMPTTGAGRKSFPRRLALIH